LSTLHYCYKVLKFCIFCVQVPTQSSPEFEMKDLGEAEGSKHVN